MATNKRLKDQYTCTALTTLAYLTEVLDFGRPKGCEDVRLADIICSEEAWEEEHQDRLNALVTQALSDIETWLKSPTPKTQLEENQVENAKTCLVVLSHAGF
jgi:oligoribonuclease NrnB/cAMP/cGMP phosphodiesterase (DHH superfamily)